MLKVAICEDEKVVLDFETSLINEWASAASCPLLLDTYISSEQFLFESEDKSPYNILVFDEGKIAEQGNHEKLILEGGLYSELWNAQTQYYCENLG